MKTLLNKLLNSFKPMLIHADEAKKIEARNKLNSELRMINKLVQKAVTTLRTTNAVDLASVVICVSKELETELVKRGYKVNNFILTWN